MHRYKLLGQNGIFWCFCLRIDIFTAEHFLFWPQTTAGKDRNGSMCGNKQFKTAANVFSYLTGLFFELDD